MILNCMRSHRRENESDPIETHEKTSLVLCLHLPCVVDFQIVTTTWKLSRKNLILSCNYMILAAIRFRTQAVSFSLCFFCFCFFFFKLAQVERNFDSEGKIFSLILFPLWGKNAKTARLIRPIILNLPHMDRRSAEILSASLCSYISMPNVSPCPRPATRVNKPACGAGTFHLLWWRENREQKGAMSNTRRFQFLWNVPPSVFSFCFF